MGGVATQYPQGAKFGHVTNITDYGAFVELGPGVEVLFTFRRCPGPRKTSIRARSSHLPGSGGHGSGRRSQQAPDRLETSGARPILGRLPGFPSAGSEVEGEIKNITEFGLFVGLVGDIDGMAHLSDLSWSESGEEAIKTYAKGDRIKAKVLDVDVEKERISLGVKQLLEDPFKIGVAGVKKGRVVRTVKAVVDKGIEVDVNGVQGFIRKADLSRDRADQRRTASPKARLTPRSPRSTSVPAS